MKDLEQAIRERAYHLWVESGCQDGQSDHHWLAAQRQILGASLGEIAAVAKIETPAAKPKKASAKPKAPRKKRAA